MVDSLEEAALLGVKPGVGHEPRRAGGFWQPEKAGKWTLSGAALQAHFRPLTSTAVRELLCVSRHAP